MRYIKLGNTGLDISPIALGCMTYGEPNRGHPVWSLGEQESRPLIQQAVEAGINFFCALEVRMRPAPGRGGLPRSVDWRCIS
jgi:predicted aldo/keto reductase-like oxidoreductase